MELHTLEVDAEVARKAYLDYRRIVREHRTDEDEQMMRAYKAASKGQRLIRLPEALVAGGLTYSHPIAVTWWDSSQKRNVANGRYMVSAFPKLAVARADVQHVYCRGVERDGSVTFDYNARGSAQRATRQRFDVRAATFARPAEHEGRQIDEFTSATRKVAMVPSIPPALRPPGRSLDGFHILWEAEWKVRPLPPGDPALLKHVGGDLYAVLAVWDLTPLEQAVLAGTRGEPTTIGE